MRSVYSVSLIWMLLAGAATAQSAGQQPAKEPAKASDSPFKTVKEKASYSIGLAIGKNLKQRAFDVDLNVLLKGLNDALAGAPPQLSQDEMLEAMSALETESQKKQEELAKVLGEKNKADGAAFLAANKNKQGVKTLPSGLQYKVLKSGTGKSPKPADTVTTHYKGTLIDGTVFDTSHGGDPVSFPVGGVIKGWTEALQLMKPGDKWELYIPSSLAYGERGAGGTIGPNATLVFEVELLSIDMAPEPLKKP